MSAGAGRGIGAGADLGADLDADCAIAPACGESAPCRIAQGHIYLSACAFERHFAGSGGIVLLREGRDLLMLPVRQASAGGYLAKIRNSAGDRVVTAPDFFRAEDVADDAIWQGSGHWSQDKAALICRDFFP